MLRKHFNQSRFWREFRFKRQSIVRILKSCVTLVPVLLSSVAAASQSDSAIKNLLIGLWASDRNNPANDVERGAIKLLIFGTTRYEKDGTGFTNIYTGGPCGQLVRHHVFHWTIEDGVLTTYGGKTASKDRVLRITSANAVLMALTDPNHPKEYRRKLSDSDCR
jgi:hypothetical protein